MPSSYDDLPYGSRAVPEMHPNRMATVARLFGLDPAPVRTCRVLEIGCAEGGNAIPLAVALPEAHVVGVDLSERQVAIGNRWISALGLCNVELVHGDLGALKLEHGSFDYVCAHGVYSWIAPQLQEKLLGACHDLLSPNGVAYVSYNTHPGWSAQLVLREMACYRTRRESDVAQKVGAARRILAGVAAPAKGSDGGYRALLAEEWAAFERLPDEYLFHEHLEDENHPCWFHDFSRKAAAAGLTYVADALFGATPAASVLPGLVRTLDGIAADRFEREQYLDFLHDRSFRQSLLCRSERVPLAEPDPSVLDRYHVVTQARPRTTPAGPGTAASVELVSQRGEPLETDDPVLKAGLSHLWERFPEAVPVAELVRLLSVPGAGGQEGGPGPVRKALLEAWAGRFIDILEHVPAYAPRPGLRPVASPLARLQAESRGGSVSSLLHRNIGLKGLELLVLARLDGTRSAEELARETAGVVVAEGLMRDEEGNTVSDPGRVRELVDRAVGPILEGLAKDALLTA